MCPVCLATTLLVIAGAASTGGVAALAAKKLRAKGHSRTATPTEGDPHGPPEDRAPC